MHKLLEHPVLGPILRLARYGLLIIVTYLLQVSVMPYLQIGSIAPNILLVTISVIAVGFGLLRSFWTGAIFGILL